MPILRITFVSLESLKYFFKSVSISLFSNFRLYKTRIINKRSHNCTQIADNQCECPCWQELWKNNSHQMWNSANIFTYNVWFPWVIFIVLNLDIIRRSHIGSPTWASISCLRVYPCVSEGHCEYTSFHKYVITICAILGL